MTKTFSILLALSRTYDEQVSHFSISKTLYYERKNPALEGLQLKNSGIIFEKFWKYTESDYGRDFGHVFYEIKLRLPLIYELTKSQLALNAQCQEHSSI